MMVMVCPLMEVVDRVPETGSNKVKSALLIALLPRHAREVVDKVSATLSQLVATHLGHARISERDVQ